METGLVNLATTLGVSKTTVVYMYPNFGNSMFGGAPGVATIETGSSVSYFSVLFHNYVGVFYGKYLNGTWTWEPLAFNSKTTNSITKVVSGGTLDCHMLYKVGNTVFASVRIHSLDNVATDQTFCTIPSGFRPKQSTYVNAFATITHNGTTRIGQAIFLQISPNGDVNGSYSASATLSQIFFSASWSVE